jgi:hypothetical protein
MKTGNVNIRTNWLGQQVVIVENESDVGCPPGCCLRWWTDATPGDLGVYAPAGKQHTMVGSLRAQPEKEHGR